MNRNVAKNKPPKMLNSRVKPILNSAEWGKRAEINGELFAWCVPRRSNSDSSPAIGMIDVDGPHVKFLNTKNLGKELAKTKLMNIAFHNLEDQLSNIKWEFIEIEIPKSSNIKIAFLRGNEYCAEAILSKKVMKGAHDLLGDDMLFAIIPCRGVLMASKIHTDYDHAALFYKYGLYYYFNTSKVTISPDIWLVSNGEVKDISSPPGNILENIKNSYRDQFISVQKRKNIRVNQKSINSKGIEVRATVNSDSYESTLSWLQRDIRGLAEKMSHQFHAVPIIHVILEIESNSKGITKEIHNELLIMCNFLSKQFQIFDYKVNKKLIKVTGALDEIIREQVLKSFWVNKNHSKNNIIYMRDNGVYFSTIPSHLISGITMKVISSGDIRDVPEIFTANCFVIEWESLRFLYDEKNHNKIIFHYDTNGSEGCLSFVFSNKLDREMCFKEVESVIKEKQLQVKIGSGLFSSLKNRMLTLSY